MNMCDYVLRCLHAFPDNIIAEFWYWSIVVLEEIVLLSSALGVAGFVCFGTGFRAGKQANKHTSKHTIHPTASTAAPKSPEKPLNPPKPQTP